MRHYAFFQIGREGFAVLQAFHQIFYKACVSAAVSAFLNIQRYLHSLVGAKIRVLDDVGFSIPRISPNSHIIFIEWLTLAVKADRLNVAVTPFSKRIAVA